MKVNRVDISVNMLANKQRTYLYNELFSLAKEHKVYGEFGQYYTELSNVPKPMIEMLRKLKIKFSEHIKD